MAVKPIAEGYTTVNTYLMVSKAAALIPFLEKAFGAKVLQLLDDPDGRVAHAELQIGESRLMLGEPRADSAPMPCSIYMYVPDTDATYKSALDAGAESLMAPADHFYGDRGAGVKDPSGNIWWIGTHIEDVSPEEIARRAKATSH